MENIKGTFEVSPSTNIIGVLGSSGYTLETALADIVDNSIAAKATEIRLKFNIKNTEDDMVLIIDNGCGMSLETMKKAAILAHIGKDEKRNVEDLGRYSCGLKSASMSFCDRLYIVSKEKGKVANTVILDFGEIIKTHSWNAYEASVPEYENLIDESGTIIVWKKLKIINNNLFDKRLLNEKIASVEMHFSHTYSDYLKHNSIKIYIEKNQIIPWDPFMLCLDNTKIVSKNTIMYKDEKIISTTYILPVASSLSELEQKTLIGRGLGEQQGFYIYRNGRVISEGGWLNLPGLTIDNKSQYARIRVDIPTTLDDEFKVNFMKNSIEIPEELKSQFIKIAKIAKRESLHNYAYMKDPTLKKHRKKKDVIPVWSVINTDDGIYLNINENHPIIMEITKDLSIRNRKKLFSLLSKSIPVDRVQNNGFNNKGYTEQEIKQLLEETFDSLKSNGLTIEEIKQKMSDMEPFNQEIYFSYLVEFFFRDGGK